MVKKFLKADNGEGRAKVLLDIERIYNAVAANPLWDQNRIAVMGGSYGGFMALHSMVNLNNFVRCGIDVVGISNFVTFLKTLATTARPAWWSMATSAYLRCESFYRNYRRSRMLKKSRVPYSSCKAPMIRVCQQVKVPKSRLLCGRKTSKRGIC